MNTRLKAEAKLERIGTVLRSIVALYRLSPEQVDAFLGAYALFDGDWSNDNGKEEAQLKDYYSVLNHLCTIGHVEKMYIPPAIDISAGVFGNQRLFERKMTDDLGIKNGHRVLDIGCGRGRVAHHVASMTNAKVTGINLDPVQVRDARQYSRARGRADQCTFIQASLNDQLPFENGSFDACYQIQAFSYAKDTKKVLAEVFRVLEPGAKFSYLDWVFLDGYNPNDSYHVDLLNRVKPLIGAVDTPTPDKICGFMQEVGFDILFSEDVRGDQHSKLIEREA
ncbi:MAG: class I SAM-dependent methyltransferase, partial [Myxococcota bacterium]|nr:class I SAM-dependent methyltransferase [Myxococcota bacterium]